MPHAITLTHLGWTTPDGRALFSDLNLSFSPIRTGLIGRNGVGKSTLLALIRGELTPLAGSVSVTGTLGVLRQSLQPVPGRTIAALFGVAADWALVTRAGRGEATADEVAAADWTLEPRIVAALAGVGLEGGPDTAVDRLSGGERTRAALAALIFAEPDMLLLDEPTNDLDAPGREALLRLLANWRGGAVVVSHDRTLLDAMDAIVELSPHGAVSFGGNWSDYRAHKARALAAAERDAADAAKRVAAVDRQAQATIERKARKDGAAQRKRAKGDMPKILLNGRRERSQATSGGHAQMVERRREEALQSLGAARERIEVLTPFSVALAPTGLPANRQVLALDAVTFGHVPGRPIVQALSFELRGPERVALIGPNGAGKTSVLGLVAGRLRPWSGSVRVTSSLAMLDQHVGLLDLSGTIRDSYRRLNPSATENDCRAALARFAFRADGALQPVRTLSGGQMLRAGLACVLGAPTPPSLLLLDEPTNHLDIESIETVEAGLRAYDGAVLVVSHDDAFLTAVGVTRRIALAAPCPRAEGARDP